MTKVQHINCIPNLRSGGIVPKKKIQLRLYITENAPYSNQAILNLKNFCENHNQLCLDCEILDINKHPEMATKDHVQVIPTLLKLNGHSTVRVVGDLSSPEALLKQLKLSKLSFRGEC